MRRKIISQGLGGRTVFLPIKWVRDHNLSPGDEIDILPIQNDLLISCKAKKTQKEITFNIDSENEPFIRINLNALYRLGYDSILIFFKTKKQEKLIEQTVNDMLLGCEITKRKSNSLLIESVTEPSEEKQKVLLQRMFLIIKESFKALLEDLNNKSLQNKAQIKNWTKTIDKYGNFCRRNISKKRIAEEKTHFYWGLIKNLALIQHSFLHLYEHAKKPPSQIKQLFTKAEDNFSKVHKGFLKNDLQLIKEGNNNANTLLYKSILPAMKSNNSIFLYYLGEISRLTYLSTVPIIAILRK